MTEPFRVPEPSDAAIASAVNDPSWRGNRLSYSTVHAAYTVDVPTIVKAEVERALVEQSLATGVHPSIRDWRDKYLAARFPEAAPEPECPCGNPDKNGVHYLDHRSPCKPTPSAPPESCTACPCARCQAEREFMRELADWLIRWQRSFPMTSTMMDACRRVMEAQ